MQGAAAFLRSPLFFSRESHIFQATGTVEWNDTDFSKSYLIAVYPKIPRFIPLHFPGGYIYFKSKLKTLKTGLAIITENCKQVAS
jgi:hypothetical protein